MTTYFNKDWLKLDKYKDWLEEDNDSGHAKCKVCSPPKNRFVLSNMGERALISHMKGKKHIQRMQDNLQPELSSFLQNKGREKDITVSEQTTVLEQSSS